MLKNYFKRLYRRTMDEAYALAHKEIVHALKGGGQVLDCGASDGQKYTFLEKQIGLDHNHYYNYNKKIKEKIQG